MIKIQAPFVRKSILALLAIVVLSTFWYLQGANFYTKQHAIDVTRFYVEFYLETHELSASTLSLRVPVKNPSRLSGASTVWKIVWDKTALPKLRMDVSILDNGSVVIAIYDEHGNPVEAIEY